mgnify:CR=1 FL=1
MERAVTAGEKIKRDIRNADTVLNSFLDKKSSDTTLILSGKEVIIYQLEKNSIYRNVYTGKAAPYKTRFMSNVKRIQFRIQTFPDGPVVECRIELETRSREIKKEPIFIFAEKPGFGGRYVTRK